MKKCKKCHCPLEGFMAKISCLFGCKPSEKNPELCCKCEPKEEEKKQENIKTQEQENTIK
ncbi:hypothetical protein HY750_02245 [Candidatus Kuenenbacteria bacterium]|nr:hypothetical protein [Candidatus Kuenenbacteria bacterium]